MYTLNAPSPISKEQLVKKYPRVFNEGVGKLEGEYHIRLDLRIIPVQHAPRRVPVVLRDHLNQTLHDMAKQDIIAPVIKPAWISTKQKQGIAHLS